MEINTQITLGNIISIIASIGSVTVGAMVVFMRLGKLEQRLNMMWHKFKKDHNIEDED